MAKKLLYEKIVASFDKKSNVVLNDDEIEHRDRLLFVLDHKLETLHALDVDIYKSVKKKYPFITYAQVCNDITVVERMIANEKDPHGDAKKVWTRYFITENAKKALQVAMDKGDAYTVGFLLNVIGKHNLTDKEDSVKPPYEEIIPFYPEITADPTTIGIKPIENLEEVKNKMRMKYLGDTKIEEAQYERGDEA